MRILSNTTILKHEDTAWNRRVTQNIGKRECSVQEGRCTFDE